MKRLTERQRDVLFVVQRSIDECGIAPSLMEICRALEISSSHCAWRHLQALARKGWVKLGPRDSRRTVTVLFRIVPIFYETRLLSAPRRV